MSKPAILIIDDEPQIQRLLQIVLDSNDYRVLQAMSAKEGIVQAAHHLPALILLDLGLPDKSGQQVLEELKIWYKKPVIILSVQDDEESIVSALDNGAADFLTKPFRTRELLARIRSALRADRQEDQQTTIVSGDLEVDLAGRTVKRGGEFVKLTATEFDLLSLFVRNEGKVLTHQYILKQIWGTAYQTETQYLRVFVAQLRRKLETDPNHPQRFVTESRVGYRFT